MSLLTENQTIDIQITIKITKQLLLLNETLFESLLPSQPLFIQSLNNIQQTIFNWIYSLEKLIIHNEDFQDLRISLKRLGITNHKITGDVSNKSKSLMNLMGFRF